MKPLDLIPKHQRGAMAAVTGANKKKIQEVFGGFFDRLVEVWENIPGHSDDRVPLDEKPVYLHYFFGGCDWWVTELDKESGLAFGYAVLHGDWQMSEWGYIDINELTNTPPVELDFYWTVKPAGEVLTEAKNKV